MLQSFTVRNGPNELRLKLGAIVENLVIENEYDARTYGPIRLQK
jgi:hypothetical protein